LAVQQATPTYKSQSNQRGKRSAFSWFRLALYSVHGHLHGHFQRERLRGLFVDARRISMKPRRLITVRMGVFFNRTLSRLSSSEVGTARRTRSARERATATCEALAPRKCTLILVVALTPSKIPKFGALVPPKHLQSQLSGSSELAMHPQPFVHSQSHPPAEHFAILDLPAWALKIVRSLPFFHVPTFSLLPKNQGQYGAELRRLFGASTGALASIPTNNQVCLQTRCSTPSLWIALELQRLPMKLSVCWRANMQAAGEPKQAAPKPEIAPQANSAESKPKRGGRGRGAAGSRT